MTTQMPRAPKGAIGELSSTDKWVHGGDWAELAAEAERIGEESMVVNLGPVHPSTHGVLRIIVELEGETVNEVRVGTGFLHTGIEKNMEYRTWSQGVTFCTRMDYVASLFQEVGYCLAVEKAMGITTDIPERANIIRVMVMELQRLASHLVANGTTLNELGATTLVSLGFVARENVLKILENITGLRMNYDYIRPGGVADDITPEFIEYAKKELIKCRKTIDQMQTMVLENPIFKARFEGIGVITLAQAMALGLTGPCLRATGLPFDLRKTQPYCGYEEYDFEVITENRSDGAARIRVRFDEMAESLKIIYQCLERLEETQGAPFIVADKSIAWPARLSLAADGQGQSDEHVAEIMGSSMESLIHHFKLVTEGFKVPAGQAYQAIEHAKGVLGVHVVSDGGTRPYRAHFRDPSYSNLQSLGVMVEGGLLADLIVSLATLDPVLGGVDR